MTRRARPTSRRGFTLLETIVAVSLTLVLTGVVYLALDQYRQYSTAGQAEIRRLQLIRAVTARLERDLRGVLYRPETAPPAASDPLSDPSADPSANSFTISGPLDQASAASTGLFGTADTLMIHVSRPTLELSAPLDDQDFFAPQTSDLQTVAWFVAGQNGGGLAGQVSGTGLARLAGDRFALSLADDQANLGSLAAATEVLAPEIAEIRFRYFDGQLWRDDWDSVALAGLPFAVEITLTLAPELLPAGNNAAVTADTSAPGMSPADAPLHTFRTVVHLPVAALPEEST